MSTAAPSPFPTAEQRSQDRAAKRHALLQAAVQMFNQRGFHATSLDDVAASLGISKPTIYHYLGNKDQVLFECLATGLQQLLEAAAKARTEPGNGADRLCSFLRHYAEINMNDFGRCSIRTGEEMLSEGNVERYLDLKRTIDGEMRQLIEEAIADGSIAPADPMLLAFTLAGALNWAARWYDPQGKESAAVMADRMVSQLATGFLPR